MNQMPIMKWIVAIALLAVAGMVSLKVARVAKRDPAGISMDEAQPADAIIVLGAAEYRGRPSPVLEARLNHALFLYLKGLAPRVITTGGAGGDPVFTEGSVGRTYLDRSTAFLPRPSWWSGRAKAPRKAWPRWSRSCAA